MFNTKYKKLCYLMFISLGLSGCNLSDDGNSAEKTLLGNTSVENLPSEEITDESNSAENTSLGNTSAESLPSEDITGESITNEKVATQGKLSPWDRGQVELKQDVLLPIEYDTVFKHEREVFGYEPRFMPGIISFTPDNTPVMRVSLLGNPGENAMPLPIRKFVKGNYIQFLDEGGNWKVTDSHERSIRDYFKLAEDDTLLIQGGNRVPDQVVFDNQGDAYTIVNVQIGKEDAVEEKELLLYSNDNMNSWQVFEPENGLNMRIEANTTNNNSDKPPVIIASTDTIKGTYGLTKIVDGKEQPVLNRDGIQLTKPLTHTDVYLFSPKKEGGKLIVGEPVTIASGFGVKVHNVMAGASNNVATVNNKSFVVYMNKHTDKDGNLDQHYPGTPQYIVSYDHNTGEISEPVYLGDTGHRLDGHNTPVIISDSEGYLHVVLGTHWHSMKYLKSKKIADATEWEDPIFIEGNGDNSWSRNGITYAGLTIDKDDTLHLVVRGRNSKFVESDTTQPGDEGYDNNYKEILDYSLLYLRKTEEGNWEPRTDLVIPKHMGYSNWYHKVSMDREGNPYVTYMYYAHEQAKGVALQEYIDRWGGTGLKNDAVAHDPVLIRSNDGGDSWKIVETTDFY